MFCMRCGREIAPEQVFCEDCLEVMAQHPVKPGTPVQLPIRPSPSAARRVTRKKESSPQVQLKRRRNTIIWLCGLLLASWVALGFTVAMLLRKPTEELPSDPPPRSSTRITDGDTP